VIVAWAGLVLLGLGLWRVYSATCLLSGFTGLYAIGFGGIALLLGLWLG